jgi:3-methyladenine DNA glycosylase/8-oxoguanine DNA glycosylase
MRSSLMDRCDFPLMDRTRLWRPGRVVDLRRTLGVLRRGSGDPSLRFVGDSVVWASRTPQGPGTLGLRMMDGGVEGTAWGEGADWLLERIPALLGVDDDWSALDLSAYPALKEVMRGLPGMRLTATGRVLESLVASVLEQRVTGREAHRSWRQLLYRFGSPAPGPVEGMRLQPDVETLLQIPTWDWHRMGVEAARQRPIRAAATVAGRMEECVALAPDAALARLRLLPGVGEWTAAETAQRALGHPDAVSVGDFHLSDLVVCALTGRPRGDDAEMLALLAPYAGQRQRVVRLIEASGARKPRFGPRYSPLDFRAM